MKYRFLDKHYSDATGKLHIGCPYHEQTGIRVHVVIKDGYCYRSEECMVIKCKFNRTQSEIKNLLSIVW